MTPARGFGFGVLFAAVVFGVALGIGGYRLWINWKTPRPMDASALITQIDGRVRLDSSQRHAIASILDRHQKAVDSAWARVRPSLHSAIDSSQMEILSVLRTDQRGKYLAWLQVAHRGVTPKSNFSVPIDSR